MKDFLKIFQNRNFSKLFFAGFTSTMGSIIGVTAFMFYLLDKFGEQPFYATLAELMYSLPTLAVFFIVGVLADRMDRQKIAIYCDWICAALSLALIGAILLDWMPLIFAILFLRSAVSKFFFPADSAMVQGILSKDEYTLAAGLNQMVGSVFMLFGNMIAIFIYWTIGIQGAIVFDLVTYVISALLIMSMKVDEEIRLPNGNHKYKDINIKLVWQDFGAGFSYIKSSKLLMSLIFGFFMFGVVNGGLSVMPAFIMKYKLAPDNYEQMMMWMGVVFGVSVLVGSVLCSMIANKIKLSYAIVLGLFISGAAIGLCAIAQHIWTFFVFTGILGLSIPLINIGIGGWLPKIVDPKMMGRVQGWITPINMLSHTITLGLIAAFFPKFVTVEALFWVVSVSLIIVGVFYLLTLPRYEDEESEAEKEVVFKEKVPV
ncbi:MFS transporter [Fictibacillus nanhaiensis]|uniref:MFS transporter n=1 Tax=Fictibacillus nanhaiensis TaxID=742169 RepID=UPI001C9785F6|nr:MFS transporter [Fictibacillus nanhaiensis]MBY6036580.1 MFS transporter [Fictibacillus nanhaiensis]